MLLSHWILLRKRTRTRRTLRGNPQPIEVLEIRQLLTNLPTQIPADINSFRLTTDLNQTTPGLTGSYINSNLRNRAIQDDWRVSQAIAGTRVDAALDFDTPNWGIRSSVGLTSGSDSNWENFSVQWDGYIQILVNGTTLRTSSDDSSRFWIDLNRDGTFDSSGAEFIDNHWGTGQPTTDGDFSIPLNAGLYRIRLQYEEANGGNVMRLKSTPPHRLRVAYLIPSNREPQAEGVANLQENVVNYQSWLADQMERQGLGRKTFTYETEADGTTPRIHVLQLPEPDSAYRREDQFQTYDLIVAGAQAVGISPFADGEVWLLVHEASIQNSDGSKTGGIALGAGSGNGSSGGIAVVDAATLSILDADGLRDNRNYDGLIFPEYGPYPLKQGVSFPAFEGTTVSSTASSYMGAMLHELLHAFGLPHNVLNDDNFRGSVMGNGLRGWRGYAFPSLYPNDSVNLQRASAVALSASRYLQPPRTFSDTIAPTITINGAASFINGQVRINFTASDSVQLAAAVLLRGGDSIGEILLNNTNVTTSFDTPYYEAGVRSEFAIEVFDTSGNKSSATLQFTPPTSGNHAPQPKIRSSVEFVLAGQVITLSAAGSSDIDAGSTLRVEWDLDGDGTFDTAVSSNLSYDTSYSTPGTRLVRARLRDSAGAIVVSAPIPIRTVTNLSNTTAPVITGLAAATSSQRPVISWNPIAGATAYEIWITKDPSSSPYHRVTVTQPSYTPRLDLGIGNFNLWVRATNNASAGPWTLKSAFVISTPADLNSITRSQATLRPIITWNALPGAAKYDIWINDVSRGITQHVRNMNITGTSFTPPSDLPLGLYRVWIRGIASDGTSAAWSTAIEFQTMQAPIITLGQNPTFDRTPDFAWNALPGAAKYEVYIRNQNTGATTLYERNITSLNYTPSSPLSDGPYRWWTIGVSAQGIRSFWTTPIDIWIGGRTELLAPLSTTGSRTPTFSWRPVDGAVRYDLFVNLNGGPAQIIRQENLTGTSYTPTTALPLGTYRAWIRAISNTGELSIWSIERTFTIAASSAGEASQNRTALPNLLDVVFTIETRKKHLADHTPQLATMISAEEFLLAPASVDEKWPHTPAIPMTSQRAEHRLQYCTQNHASEAGER